MANLPADVNPREKGECIGGILERFKARGRRLAREAKPSAVKTAFLGELGLACRMDGVAWERRNTF